MPPKEPRTLRLPALPVETVDSGSQTEEIISPRSIHYKLLKKRSEEKAAENMKQYDFNHFRAIPFGTDLHQKPAGMSMYQIGNLRRIELEKGAKTARPTYNSPRVMAGFSQHLDRAMQLGIYLGAPGHDTSLVRPESK